MEFSDMQNKKLDNKPCSWVFQLLDHMVLSDKSVIYAVSLEQGFVVDVKVCSDSNLIYVMQNEDGSSVYCEGNTDYTFPDYAFNEASVVQFVRDIHFFQPFIGKKVMAREDLFQFSTGNRVKARERCIGIVEGFDERCVYVFNEKNPDGYKHYSLDLSSFRKWIESGAYRVVAPRPQKDILVYDSKLAEHCSDLSDAVDIVSPQEAANLFGKPVKDEQLFYFPSDNLGPLDEQIKAASPRVSDSSEVRSIDIER